MGEFIFYIAIATILGGWLLVKCHKVDGEYMSQEWMDSV